MKKISIFMAIAAAASLASCTAQAPKANLKSDLDSLSYSIGMAQTQGLKGYLTGRLNVDTAYMAEFIKGLNDGVSKTSKKDIAYMAGIQIGQQISGENGMIKNINQELFAGDSTKTISKDNFMAGFIPFTLCINRGSRTPFKRSRSIRYIGFYFRHLLCCLYNTVQAVFVTEKGVKMAKFLFV